MLISQVRYIIKYDNIPIPGTMAHRNVSDMITPRTQKKKKKKKKKRERERDEHTTGGLSAEPSGGSLASQFDIEKAEKLPRLQGRGFGPNSSLQAVCV